MGKRYRVVSIEPVEVVEGVGVLVRDIDSHFLAHGHDDQVANASKRFRVLFEGEVSRPPFLKEK
jgi:hypothetical protein